MGEKKSDIIRSVTTSLREYVNDRRRVLRRGTRFEVRLPFIVSPLGTEKDYAESPPDAPALVGHTRDLSETGLTLLLPSVRIGSVYLTDRENYLGIRLELPGGPTAMLTAPVRFEQLTQKDVGCGYLLGVRIIKMPGDERERYGAYLSSLENDRRRVRERRQGHTAHHITQNSTTQVGAWDNLTPSSVSTAFEKFLRDQRHPHKL